MRDVTLVIALAVLAGCSDVTAPEPDLLRRSGPVSVERVSDLQQTSPFVATGTLVDGTGFVVLPPEAGGPDAEPFVIVIFRRPGVDFYTFLGGRWLTLWDAEAGSWVTLIESEPGREFALYAHW